MSKWIDVKDKLPNVNCDVLCFEDGAIFVGTYIELFDGIKTWSPNESGNVEVTHWMPLPKAPKIRSK